MTTAFVRPATKADALRLAPTLRPHDVQECRALGTEPALALLAPFISGDEAFAIAEPDDTVYAMFGITSCVTWGIPWMLASTDFGKIARPFAQRSKLYFDAMASPYPYLENIVSVQNPIAHRWLEHLGFTIEHGREVKYGGVSFVPFWKYPNV